MNKLQKVITAILVLAFLAVPVFFYYEKEEQGAGPLDGITFYHGDARGIRLCPAPVEGVYNLFVPGCAAEDLRISCPATIKIVVDEGTVLKNGDEITRYVKNVSEDGVKYISARVISLGGRVEFNGYINFFFAGELPTVHITVPEADIIRINNENPEENFEKFHTAGIMRVVDETGRLDAESDVDMSRRGNTSFLHMNVKPYNLNLSRPESLLGMKTGRKYALKANSYDMNHVLRNEAAFDLARKTGMPVTCDSRFADLYINGIYNGVYMLTNRIKGDELIGLEPGGYLLELDFRYLTEKYHFESHDQGIVVHYPEAPSDEQMAYIKERYEKAYDAIAKNEGYEKYIDVDSFLKMYLIQEFFCNVDVDYASFYFYLGNDGLFHAGPLWDFDLACGIMQTLPFHEELAGRSYIIPDNGGVFLDILRESPEFEQRIREYYLNEFSPLVEEYIKGMLIEKGDRAELSLVMADVKEPFHFKGLHSLDSAVGLAEWMSERNDLLKRFYSVEEGYVSVVFHFAWGTVRTLAYAGKPLGYLPDSDHPGNEEDFWGEIAGFVTQDGTPVEESFAPSEDIDLYAVYVEEAHAWEEGYELP